MFTHKEGFTLIELLIVISIIGILAGVILAVINPVKQRQKANEAVGVANLTKACLAVKSCIAASTQAIQSCPGGWNTEYQNVSGITGCTSALTSSCLPNNVVSTSSQIRQTDYLRLEVGTCTMYCSLNTGAITRINCATN